jgi:hypothetical protein
MKECGISLLESKNNKYKIIDCHTEYGGLESNLSVTYVNLLDYSVYKLVMCLDSVQEEIVKKSVDKQNLLNSIIDKFHKNSRKIYLNEMSEELLAKLRDFKLYELLK